MKKFNLFILLQATLCFFIPTSSYGAVIHVDNGTIILNEFLADGAVGGDPNGDGSLDAIEDEFIELVNITGGSIDISGYTLWESNLGNARHTFASGTVLDSYEPIVIFGGGAPTGFSVLQVQVADNTDAGIQFGLHLDDITDRIILKDASDNIVFDAEYNSSIDSIVDQSLTRSPDVTGLFVGHDTASGGSASYSPGTLVNGSEFAPPVPVPAAVWLFGSGLIGLIGVARRQKS